MKKRLIALVMVLCLTLTLCACGGGGDDADSAKKVVVGVFEPLSGNNGAGGKQEVLGMQYAHHLFPTVEINGETYEVDLVISDNESSTDKAVTAANDLVSAGASIVLGSYGSSVAIAGSDTFESAGVPAMGVTCTNPVSWIPSRVQFWQTLHMMSWRPTLSTAWANWATITTRV